MRTAQDIFDEWSQTGQGEGMETSHWPRVSQVLTRIPAAMGNYLEIGLGNGYALEYMATHAFARGQCYGLDVSAEMVKSAQARLSRLKNVTLEQDDFLLWQPRGKRFQVIFSMEVFYYFADIRAGIAKAFDLLEPGGELIVMVDFFHENTESHDWPEKMGTPMTLWSKTQYVDGFTNAGFAEVSQEEISGGPSRDGLTLCTRGRRAATVE
ncbi:MAG: class I SAM-dependent methyltransferase [bacterium]